MPGCGGGDTTRPWLQQTRPAEAKGRFNRSACWKRTPERPASRTRRSTAPGDRRPGSREPFASGALTGVGRGEPFQGAEPGEPEALAWVSPGESTGLFRSRAVCGSPPTGSGSGPAAECTSEGGVGIGEHVSNSANRHLGMPQELARGLVAHLVEQGLKRGALGP